MWRGRVCGGMGEGGGVTRVEGWVRCGGRGG